MDDLPSENEFDDKVPQLVRIGTMQVDLHPKMLDCKPRTRRDEANLGCVGRVARLAHVARDVQPDVEPRERALEQ